LEKLPLPQVRRVDAARRRLDEIVYRLIEERRTALAASEERNDLLSLLLRATDTEENTTSRVSQPSRVPKAGREVTNGTAVGIATVGAMSDLQVRDECVTLMLAGHETTANALTWTFYLLSQHPEVEQRLHQEIDSVLHGRLPTADDLPRLRYTEMVLAESMRLYPPAWGIARRALEPHTIAGYEIPRGGVILINQFITHRDPRWYPQPEVFNPERWAAGHNGEGTGQNSRPKFAYFPFGGGPRQCIGEGFAWMEGVLLLATLAQRWRMRLADGQQIGLRPVLTLRPKYGMRMVLAAR
jgi:cytochrome P450